MATTAKKVNAALRREHLTRFRGEDNPATPGEVVLYPGGIAVWSVREALAIARRAR